ncbi:MAG: ribosome biogenesis GTPase YqeH [Bacillaceae bacterium]
MEENQVKCIGCGVTIQTEDKAGLGYAPPSSLEKETVVCQRCFRLKNYNEIQDVALTDADFLRILNGIGESNALIVKIVDIFDFTGSWLPGIQRFVGNNDVMLIGNKIDLIPKSVKHFKLINWMKGQARDNGLKVSEVHLISAAKGHGIEEVAEAIERMRNGRDVYIVGCTNVGKSTFINRMIKRFSDVTENVITTSHFPGTTLDLIDIPLDETSSMYDTPGIINHHQMAHYVGKQSLKVITPTKEIKPMVFQLNEGQTLFFGGLARLDYVSGGRRSLTCHFSNNLKIHRTKLEKADALYENHAGELLNPPTKEELENLPELVKHEFMIRERKTDIVFSGLGWVTVNEPGAKVVAYAPKGVGVLLRRSLI